MSRQKWFPNKLYMLKLMERGHLDDDTQDDLILLRIVVETVRDFVQAKCNLCWLIKKCGGLIWICCPRNPQGKADEKRRQ